jgi:hypothetical protein
MIPRPTKTTSEGSDRTQAGSPPVAPPSFPAGRGLGHEGGGFAKDAAMATATKDEKVTCINGHVLGSFKEDVTDGAPIEGKLSCWGQVFLLLFQRGGAIRLRVLAAR